MKNSTARIIAFYLPQYHPIPENDKYWGKGFTEWTNVAKAKPLFRGHVQPNIPADLGFYDLRLPEIRDEQAKLAKEAGIEGFCYWHYWFGNGKEVLERPLDEMVETGHPDFPFCIGWAMHDWTTKTWEKKTALSKDVMIFKQDFPGEADNIQHFYRLLRAFRDPRYIKVDGKLLFMLYNAEIMPKPNEFMTLWNNLAAKNGLPGFHFVASIQAIPKFNPGDYHELDKFVNKRIDDNLQKGFDAITITKNKYAEIKSTGLIKKAWNVFLRRFANGLYVEKYDYRKVMKHFFMPIERKENVYPELLVGWDRTPRAGRKAIVYYNSTPQNLEKAAEMAITCVNDKQPDHQIIFLEAWNEWGEGAYMEPDLKYGKGKLNALQTALGRMAK